MASTLPDEVIETPKPHQSFHTVLYVGTIVVLALYFGRDLFIPLVLASFLAFVLAPACRQLEKLRLPRVPAVIIVVILVFGAMGGLGMVVGQQAGSLSDHLPAYQATILDKWKKLSHDGGFFQWLAKPSPPAASNGATPSNEDDLGFATKSRLALARTLAEPLLGPIATGGIVLIFTIFILLSSEDLRDRLVRLLGRRDLHRTILAMNDAARRLSRYFLYQLGLNAGFGLIIGTALWIADLPNPLLWGILAGFMRFVPFIGVFIALVPPVLLALATASGWSFAFVVLGLFIGGEFIMGQVVEPLVYGRSTGLSPIAVIVATAFWALLWGPIGLLIATPLTVCLVVIGRHVQALAFLDVIFGDTPPLEPPETFYQRALEGTAIELVPDARKRIATTSLMEYFDTVALPGLALAQGDLARDALGFERLEAIHTQISSLLVELERPTKNTLKQPQTRLLSDDWTKLGSVICVPARGQLDDLAATMAGRALLADGFGVRLEHNDVFSASSQTAADLVAARVCCLSVLEEGNTVSGIRYFVRRIQKRMPRAIIVIGLWHAERSSALLRELREGGGREHVVLSISELTAFARSLPARGAGSKIAPVAQE